MQRFWLMHVWQSFRIVCMLLNWLRIDVISICACCAVLRFKIISHRSQLLSCLFRFDIEKEKRSLFILCITDKVRRWLWAPFLQIVLVSGTKRFEACLLRGWSLKLPLFSDWSQGFLSLSVYLLPTLIEGSLSDPRLVGQEQHLGQVAGWFCFTAASQLQVICCSDRV